MASKVSNRLLLLFKHDFLFNQSFRCGSTATSTTKIYKQGQNDPDKPKIREYFYYIDHNGMLFLDDSRMKNFTSCFKEKVFLNFFFKNIKFNKTGRYEKEFPYISLCGIERNFIRCDDVPIVYTHIVPRREFINKFDLVIAYSDLVYPFNPESLYVLPESINTKNDKNGNHDDDDSTILKHGGRIYHEADDRFGNYGLIRSVLAQEIGNLFVLDDKLMPVIFKWNGTEYRLTNKLASVVIKPRNIGD